MDNIQTTYLAEIQSPLKGQQFHSEFDHCGHLGHLVGSGPAADLGVRGQRVGGGRLHVSSREVHANILHDG